MMASPEYVALKVDPRVTKVIKSEVFWRVIFELCKACYPPLRLLRICDQRMLAMDQLFYFVRQKDAKADAAEESLNKLDIGEHDDIDELVKDLKNLLMSSAKYKEKAQPGVQTANVKDLDGLTGEQFSEPIAEMDNTPYDSSVDEGMGLGSRFVSIWKHRRPALAHDYAIAGWLMSPHPVIMADVKENWHKEPSVPLAIDRAVGEVVHTECSR